MSRALTIIGFVASAALRPLTRAVLVVGYRWREPRWEVRDGAYIRIDGGWIGLGPVAAPPAVRVERVEVRPGHIWVRGHWDWVNGSWTWIPGHHEPVRAGYIWREPRWELRDGVYVKVEGAWVVR